MNRTHVALSTTILVVATSLVSVGARPAAAAPTSRGSAADNTPLVAQNVHFRRDSIGGLWAFGEVVNKGHADASEVGLEIDLYGKANVRVARGVSMRVSRNVLPPGGVAVWTTTMSDSPKTWDHVSFRIVEQIGADEIHAANYTQFSIAHIAVKTSNPGYAVKVTGTVTNSGTKTAKVANVITAFYDAKGTLLYVDDQGLLYPYASTQLVAPSKRAPFQSSAITYLKKPARVVVTVRASTKGPDGFYPD